MKTNMPISYMYKISYMWEITVCSCQEQRSELQLVGLSSLLGLAAANYHKLTKVSSRKSLLTLGSICINICCVTNVYSVHLSLSYALHP